jgi:hypothetical protein
MTGSIATVSRNTERKAGTRAGRKRSRWGRLVEAALRLSVISILGLAAQQSVSGYQTVHASFDDILATRDASPLPGELVFAPDGSASGAIVIEIADATGATSTITIDEAGEITVN